MDFSIDHYNGVVCSANGLPEIEDEFRNQMSQSLERWKEEGRRGVWLKLPTARSALLPAAVELGFDYHHAQLGYAMLVKWLPDTPSTIPESLLYNVGVGAYVLNSKNEMLLVQEANGILKGRNIWKMPTGLVDRGEDVSQAVEREVLEETGLRVKFDQVLVIRQTHGLMFGKSDIFFVCACKLEDEGTSIQKQESELAAACWMPIQEASELPIFKMGPFRVVMEACRSYTAGQYKGFTAEVMTNDFVHRKELIMHVQQHR